MTSQPVVLRQCCVSSFSSLNYDGKEMRITRVNSGFIIWIFIFSHLGKDDFIPKAERSGCCLGNWTMERPKLDDWGPKYSKQDILGSWSRTGVQILPLRPFREGLHLGIPRRWTADLQVINAEWMVSVTINIQWKHLCTTEGKERSQ